MKTLTSLLARVLCPTALAALAPADVIVVDDDGPADFSQINVAIANSQNGDTILVRSGTYFPVPIIERAVHVIADAGATVQVEGYVAVLGLQAGQTVVVSGLEVIAQEPAHIPLFLNNNDGAVRIQECAFRGFAPPTGGDDENLAMGGTAVSVSSSHDVSISRSAISGGDGETAFNPFFCLCYSGAGGFGMEVNSSRVALHDTMVHGGASGEASYGGAGGTGIRLQNSDLFLSGGLVRGGNGGPIQDIIPLCEGGGDGIFASANSTARMVDTTVAGGTKSWFPGDGGDCEDGLPTTGPGTFETLGVSSRSLNAPRVVREGSSVDLVFTGEPGDIVLLARSLAPGHLFSSAHQGTWLIHYPPLMPVLPIGTLDAGGVLSYSYTPTSLFGGMDARSELLQALHLGGASGRVVGATRHLLVVDASL